jgi:hypothetical protein
MRVAIFVSSILLVTGLTALLPMSGPAEATATASVSTFNGR